MERLIVNEGWIWGKTVLIVILFAVLAWAAACTSRIEPWWLYAAALLAAGVEGWFHAFNRTERYYGWESQFWSLFLLAAVANCAAVFIGLSQKANQKSINE